jgi:hypothetical protein
LHGPEGAPDVEPRAADVVLEVLPASTRHEVSQLTVTVENTIQMDISLIKVFYYEKVILVDPIGVTGLEAAHRVHRSG